jgi:hypothetical protein
VGLVWAANALWQRHQERQAQEKLERQPKPAPRPVIAAPPARPVITAEGRRYQEVQEEIRRKIAERWQTPAPGRPAMPLPPPVAPSPPRYVARQVEAPRPVAPMVPAIPTADQRASTAAFSVELPSAPQTSLSAYSMGGPEVEPAAALRAALANTAAVRQAFLFREILDRPLCLRPAGCGGHEAWT